MYNVHVYVRVYVHVYVVLRCVSLTT